MSLKQSEFRNVQKRNTFKKNKDVDQQLFAYRRREADRQPLMEPSYIVGMRRLVFPGVDGWALEIGYRRRLVRHLQRRRLGIDGARPYIVDLRGGLGFRQVEQVRLAAWAVQVSADIAVRVVPVVRHGCRREEDGRAWQGQREMERVCLDGDALELYRQASRGGAG